MKILSPLFVIAAFLFYCSINPLVDNGGTTEITNAKIKGQLCEIYMGSDITPVANAGVALHSMVSETRTTITDSTGFFHFDSVDTGRYWLEGNSSDSIGLLKIVDVNQSDTLIEMTVLLKRMGGIRGKIEVDTTINDPDSVYKTTLIFIPEIKIELKVDTNGVFEDLSLPPYNNYTVIISNHVFPSYSDIFKVIVEEGKVTELDNTNNPPLFTHNASAMTNKAYLNEEYKDTVHAIDPDGDSLEFILIKGPYDMVLTDSIITWTPSTCSSSMGMTCVSVRVQDNKGGFDTLEWNIHIRYGVKSSILLLSQ